MNTLTGPILGVGKQGWRARRVSPWVCVPALVFALCGLAMGRPAQAAVFNIASGDAAALIAAINTANRNGTKDTINLAAGTYTLTKVNNDTDGPNGLPSITSTITIKGVGAESTIITGGSFDFEVRIIHVASSGSLTIEGVTITGGFIDSIGDGGGIRNSGTLILTHSIIRDNTTSGVGGGIFNDRGTLTVTHSTVSSNFAGGTQTGEGGGILTIEAP